VAGPVYTGHTREQMAERGVTSEEVEAVLRERTWSRPSTAGKRVLTAVVAGRAIDVVIVPTAHPPRVVSLISHGRRREG